MGQKVHPIGIRLGIVKDWSSKWYANSKEFPEYVKQDHEVIAPTITFIAPINAIIYCNAKPIFMDSDEKFNLDIDKTIAYAGSLIQQNHGEILGHGIMVWDLKTKKSEFVEIVNDYGYYTYEIDNGKIINPTAKVPKKPRLRLKVKDTDSGTLKQIIADIEGCHIGLR